MTAKLSRSIASGLIFCVFTRQIFISSDSQLMFCRRFTHIQFLFFLYSFSSQLPLMICYKKISKLWTKWSIACSQLVFHKYLHFGYQKISSTGYYSIKQILSESIDQPDCFGHILSHIKNHSKAFVVNHIHPPPPLISELIKLFSFWNQFLHTA